MRVICVGYREWALNIYDNLARNFGHPFLIIRNKEQYDEELIKDFQPDLILYYGWSWIVPEKIIEQYKCIMLHPAPLPKFRGGSPIQNQIIRGIKKSAVTLFIMNKELDAGDIVAQEEFSLEGSLDEILNRITQVGYKLTKSILTEGLEGKEQDHSKATYYKRRKPWQSEITIEELKTKKAQYLYDKIRMLADPYPNAFIKTIDGEKLLIKKAEIKK